MADVLMTVYPTTRAIATAPNLTDNGTAATSSNTYLIPNNGKVLLCAKAATTATMTIATPNSVDGNAIADLALALPDADQYIVGPFPPSVYNNSAGQLSVTVSANVTLFPVRL